VQFLQATDLFGCFSPGLGTLKNNVRDKVYTHTVLFGFISEYS